MCLVFVLSGLFGGVWWFALGFGCFLLVLRCFLCGWFCILVGVCVCLGVCVLLFSAVCALLFCFLFSCC